MERWKIAALILLLGLVVFLSLHYGRGWAVAAKSQADNLQAAAEAQSANLQIMARKASGEQEPIQVSGCMQRPDNWTQPHYPVVTGAIFVSVASYRDDECSDTVSAIFNQAERPDDIYVGVVQQNSSESNEDCLDRCPECSARKESGHIRVKNFSHLDAKGPTFARYEASKLWRGEELYLQIDSHTQFIKGWDKVMREQIAMTRDPAHCVLGAYPPTQDQYKQMHSGGFKNMIIMCANRFDVNGLPELMARIVASDGKPRKGYYCGANLICFPGKALYDVPFDPYLAYLFFGEELLFSVRLWTAGYDIYAPAHPFAIHHYERKGKPKYWEDHRNFESCRKRAIQRAKYFFGLASKFEIHPDYALDLSKYGMGKKRKLSQYLNETGIDLWNRVILKPC